MALPKQSGTKRKLHADDEESESYVSETESDVSESLSDIDDAEIAPYLNNKKEALYMSIVWEAMNKGSDKGKSRKKARKSQKSATLSKRTIEWLSLKINYEALEKLNVDDGNRAPDSEEGSHGDMQHLNGKFDSESQSFGGSYDDELDNENAYSDEAEGRQGYEDDEEPYISNDDYNEYGSDEYASD